MKKSIGFRFDGNNIMGMGHAFRCLNIIEELQAEDVECVVIAKDYPDVVQVLDEKNIKVHKIKKNLSLEEEVTVINKICEESSIDTIVIDKLNSEPNYIRQLKNQLKTIIAFDDCGEGTLYIDILINAIIPTEYNYNTAKLYKGNDYIVLNRAFLEFNQKEKQINDNIKNVLLTFGGSDPKNITKHTINELKRLRDIDITIVLGPAYRKLDELTKIINNMPNYTIIRNAKNMPELIYNSDLCFVSGGITLYEVAAIGTPSIVVCQVEHQVKTAERFEKDGVVINLGLIDELKEGQIISAFNELNNDIKKRQALSTTGKKYVDGKGLYRVKKIILDALSIKQK